MDVGIKVGDMTVQMTVTDKNKDIVAKKQFTADDLFEVAKIDGDASNVTVQELEKAGFHVNAADFGNVMGQLQKMRGTLKPRVTTTITTMDQVAVGKELKAQEKAFFTAYAPMRKERNAEATKLENELTTIKMTPSNRNVLSGALAAPESAGGKQFQAFLQTLPQDKRDALVAKLKQYAIVSNQRDAAALSIMVNCGETPEAGQTQLNAGRQAFMDGVNQAAAKSYYAQGGKAQYMALAFHATGDGSNTSAYFVGQQGTSQSLNLGDLQYSDKTGLNSVTDADSRKEHREALESGNLKPVLVGANTATFKLPNVDPNADSPVVLGVGGNDGAGVKVTVQYGDTAIHLVGSGRLRLDKDFPLPAGFQFDEQNQVLTPPKGATPGAKGITVTMASNAFENNKAIEGQSDNPFDEMFVVTRTVQVITPEVTVNAVPTLPTLPPPPETKGVAKFVPNSPVIDADNSQFAQDVDAMATFLADHPDAIAKLDVSLLSRGAVHNGTPVDESAYAGKTYGDTVNGETLTTEATANDRKSDFKMVLKDGKYAIQGTSSADPFKATITNVDRTKLKAFMDKHPKLTENDALGALRQFALLDAFQTTLNDKLKAQGKPPVDLLSHASVKLERDGTAMAYADFKAIQGK